MIIEANGELREVKNTVSLEGANCQCYYAVGGCPRADYIFWREIWLKKINPKHVDVALKKS